MTTEQFNDLLKLNSILSGLKEQDEQLSLDIELSTAWIKEHQKSKLLYECKENHLWRRISCQLHQHRSKLKTKQDKIRDHLHAVARKYEEFGAEFPGMADIPDFSDPVLEMERDMAGV